MNRTIDNTTKEPIKRAGVDHPPGKKTYPHDAFTVSQWVQIRSDVRLIVADAVAPKSKSSTDNGKSS